MVNIPNDIKSTLFEFATIRSPQKPTAKAQSANLGTITYSGTASSFYVDLTKAKQTTGDAYTRMDALKAVASTFRYSKSYLDDLTETQHTLAVLGSTLVDNSGSVTVRGLAGVELGSYKPLSTTEFNNIWDNLICRLILSEDMLITADFINVLRASNFLSKYHNIRLIKEELDVQILASATIVLPNTIFPLPWVHRDYTGNGHGNGPTPANTIIKQADKGGNANTTGHTYTQKMASFDVASSGVKKLIDIDKLKDRANRRNMKIEPPLMPDAEPIPDKNSLQTSVKFTSNDFPANDKSKNDPTDKNYLLLTQDKFAKLSASEADTLKNTLEQLSIEDGTNFYDILTRITEEKNRVANSYTITSKGGKTLVRVGGGIWEMSQEEEEPHTHEPPMALMQQHRSGKNEYSGNWKELLGKFLEFYGDDRACNALAFAVSEYKRVEMKLCCYKPGEVAHIENVLQGEHKERSTRRLLRTEETVFTSKEVEEVQERDTITTDQYEMEKESQKVVQTDMHFDVGVSVDYESKPWHVAANTNFSLDRSVQQSNREAVNYSKSVTQRALDRVINKTKTERTTTTIEEFEEKNSHGLDNRGGTGHVVGTYRWVDKEYQCEVWSYGRKMVLEFLIPEPATFHLWAMANPSAETGMKLKEPKEPKGGVEFTYTFGDKDGDGDWDTEWHFLFSHLNLNSNNYFYWAAEYGATVSPPPAEYIIISDGGGITDREFKWDKFSMQTATDDLKVPDGYMGDYAHIQIMHEYDSNKKRDIWLSIGEWATWSNSANGYFDVDLFNVEGIISLMLISRSTFCTWTGDFYCKRKPETYEQWQIDTYNAIMEAYGKRVKEFQNALAQARALRGVDIRGTNPAINRQIEQQELKKGCIEWLYEMGLEGSNAMIEPPTNVENPDCYPPGEYNLCASQFETLTQLRFAEQALDWKLMTYRFYPYFWANKCRWKKLYQLDDVDPLFLNFLQAGYARVLVPVSEGYEKLVLFFLQNGYVFPFEDSPIIGGDLAENMLRDLMPEHLRDGATKLPQTWKLRVPTTLTALQCGSGCIEGTGLPCDCHKPNSFNKDIGTKLIPVISKEDAVINVSKGPVAQNTLQIKR